MLAATAGGMVLAAGLAGAAAVLRRRPLHAKGRTYEAIVHIEHAEPVLGVPLLAAPGVHPCTARISRALSTPTGWPDVGGLAIRLPQEGRDGGAADLLFATTGTGRLMRHVLRPTRHAADAPMTTLLPTEAGGHHLLFELVPRADADPPTVFDLSVAVDRGRWRAVGRLELGQEVDDGAIRFDPVVAGLRGTRPPAWVTRLREPAYRWSRRLSGVRPGADERRALGVGQQDAARRRSVDRPVA
jgi:hypothetical protein